MRWLGTVSPVLGLVVVLTVWFSRNEDGLAEKGTTIHRSLLNLWSRRLPDKYHPDKDDISCSGYGASAIAPQAEGGYYGRDDDGIRTRSNFWGWLQGDNGDRENGMPPPCRGSSSDDGNFSHPLMDLGEDDDDDAINHYNNDDPVPAPLSDGDEWQDNVSQELVPATLHPATPLPIPQDADSPTPAPQIYPSVILPPPLEQVQQEMPKPSLQPYYTTDVEAEEDETASFVENIVRIAVSIALPPRLDRGIPREVGKAVTKLMNVTAGRLRDKSIPGRGSVGLLTFSSLFGNSSSQRRNLAGILGPV